MNEIQPGGNSEYLNTKQGAAYFNITPSAYRKLLKTHYSLLTKYIIPVRCQGKTGVTQAITKEGLVVLATLKDGDRGNQHKIIRAPNAPLQGKKIVAERAIATTRPKFSLGEPLGLGFMPLPTVQLKEISKRSAIWNIISQLVSNPQDQSEYSTWYKRIYKQLLARYGKNIEVRAKGNGIKAIEQVEKEGLMEEAYAIAYKFLEESLNPKIDYKSPYED